MPYTVGDDVTVTAVWTDPNDDGAGVDPGAVHLTVLKPDGSTDVYEYGEDEEVVKDDTGSYHAVIDADQAGVWFYYWWSERPAKRAKRKSFNVTAGIVVEE